LRFLYNCLIYCAMPFALLRLVWKSRRTPAYLKRWNERFGFVDLQSAQGGIWVHAVSVGETIAVVPLIKRLQASHPDLPITVTTMTPTGSERVTTMLGDTVHHTYVPYDLPGAMKRFLKRLQPRLCLIMETEIWPNLLHQCQRQGVPTLLANARMSAKSAKAYRRVARFSKSMINEITIIAAQSASDAARFRELGATAEQLHVTGSVKFDVTIPASLHEKAAVFRARWGGTRQTWVAASTHEGEEELVLKAFAKVLEQLPDTLLLLVPRHPERFAKVASLCEKHGFATVLRSHNQPCLAETKVFLGDSMGELGAYYAASDLAFVGGSLIPIGGHNLLEPAAVGVAAITGPNVFNFTEITRLLMEAGAVKLVQDYHALAEQVIALLNDRDARSKAGLAGQQVVEQNRGAVDAHLALIDGIVAGSSSPSQQTAPECHSSP